jgi:predicted RNA-binding Zn ribbon-like protein
MGEEQRTFRFLADDEFQRLASRDKAAYLVRAQQELAERQLKLREQLKDLMKQQKNGRA